jgi:hypothetical protein
MSSTTTAKGSTSTTSATTSVTSSSSATEHRTGRVSWARGLAVALVAAVVVTAVAAAFDAAGHELAVTDGPIPLLGFAQMVLLFSVVGVVIARHTRRVTFFRVTLALTVLSCVPDLALGDGVLSKAGLVLTHVVAAAIVIPRLARR